MTEPENTNLPTFLLRHHRNHSHHRLRHSFHHDMFHMGVNMITDQTTTPDTYYDGSMLSTSVNPIATWVMTSTQAYNVSDSVTNGTTSACVNNNKFYKPVYRIVVPMLIFFCILSIIVNAIVVLSARWCRRPMSPTMYFSVSLAVADTFSSLNIVLGLVMNSLIPCVYNVIIPNKCGSMAIEAFRVGTILVSVAHLLALAINHWIGIARPLHYAATMTRRTAWTVIIVSWVIPNLFILLYFSIHPNQGFQAPNCAIYSFLLVRPYRLMFASFVCIPLIAMSFIYIHIYIIIKHHQFNRRRYQSTSQQTCQQLQKNIKAVSTTVVILGTYIVGFGPGIVWFILVCNDCVVNLNLISPEVNVPVSIVNNTLIILKVLVNPIIYAARMSDIKLALRKMQYAVLSKLCGRWLTLTPPIDPMDRGYSTSHRSMYDSRNTRASRRSSGNSNRRAGQLQQMNQAQNQQPEQVPMFELVSNPSQARANPNNGNVPLLTRRTTEQEWH